MGQIFRSKVKSPSRLEKDNRKTSKRVYPGGFYGASLRNIRIAPRKVRLVVDQIRGTPVERAREVLRYSHKKAAYLLDRVLLSALGNADVKSGGSVGAADLFVAECYADEGPRLRRYMAGPKGGARPIMRRMCHITVVLGENEKRAEPKTKGKAKGQKAAPKKTKEKAAAE